MKVNLFRSIIRSITAAALILAALPVTANPLCASPEQRQTIQSAFKESPKSSPAKISGVTGIPEAAVVHALPVDARTPVDILEIESVWQAITEWGDAMVIVPSSGSLFELFGALPEGETQGGYFNFDSPNSPFGGHLKLDRMAAMYMFSIDGKIGKTHQVAIYDLDGQRVFSIYVPRDSDDVIKPQPLNSFLRMKRDYSTVAKRSLPNETGCLWEVNTDAIPVPVED